MLLSVIYYLAGLIKRPAFYFKNGPFRIGAVFFLCAYVMFISLHCKCSCITALCTYIYAQFASRWYWEHLPGNNK